MVCVPVVMLVACKKPFLQVPPITRESWKEGSPGFPDKFQARWTGGKIRGMQGGRMYMLLFIFVVVLLDSLARNTLHNGIELRVKNGKGRTAPPKPITRLDCLLSGRTKPCPKQSPYLKDGPGEHWPEDKMVERKLSVVLGCVGLAEVTSKATSPNDRGPYLGLDDVDTAFF